MASIKVYARIKPSRRKHDDYDTTNETLYLRVGKKYQEQIESKAKPKQSQTANHEFKFSYLFNEYSTQEQVFDTATRGIVDGFLSGYNGTIFAYGQTGSGKTHTVQGSALRFEDRGMAPRALSMVYSALESRPDDDITVHISYMEIYQEVGYDLLNPGARTNSPVTPFPKVAVVEGPRGSCIIRNLTSHLAATEDVAQSLLLQGQANRKVAETPMNHRSSRSHAIFTITLTCKKQDSDTITKSKLHLVDLAGSERVSKTGIEGLQLTEAKFINLSLHYLEGVIIALHQEATGQKRRDRSPSPYAWTKSKPNGAIRSRSSGSIGSWFHHRPSSADGYRPNGMGKHIPYRNSLLTMVLRDSLGGNCLTAMIATVSLEEENLSESISTCRFAQRVACITNQAKKNEEIDDKSMIKRLRKRIAELEAEVACLRAKMAGGESVVLDASVLDKKLSNADIAACAKFVQEYIRGKVKDPITSGMTNPLKSRECLKLMKNIILVQLTGQHGTSDRPVTSTSEVTNNSNISNTSTATNGFSERIPNTKGEEGLTVHARSSSAPVSVHARSRSSSAEREIQHKNRVKEIHQGINHFSDERPYTAKTTSKKDAYKSPFQRKREKEIKKLSEKVEQREEQQKEERQHLEKFRGDIREQQLTLIEKELWNKLSVTDGQLAEQHSYLLQLKRSNSDSELLQQEKLVERQLRKRQAKMEKRLRMVQDQLEKLRRINEEQNKEENDEEKDEREIVKTPRTLKELEKKYPHLKGKDGKINSRHVLDILKYEDQQQQKMESKIHRDRVAMVSKQLEVKEAATRQKLLDFREKLLQAKNGLSHSPINAFGENSGQSKQPVSSTNGAVNLDDTAENDASRDQNRLASLSDEESSFTTDVASESSPIVQNSHPTRDGPQNGSQSDPFRSPSSAPVRSKAFQSPTARWESAYSTRGSSSRNEDFADFFRTHQNGIPPPHLYNDLNSFNDTISSGLVNGNIDANFFTNVDNVEGENHNQNLSNKADFSAKYKSLEHEFPHLYQLLQNTSRSASRSESRNSFDCDSSCDRIPTRDLNVSVSVDPNSQRSPSGRDEVPPTGGKTHQREYSKQDLLALKSAIVNPSMDENSSELLLESFSSKNTSENAKSTNAWSEPQDIENGEIGDQNTMEEKALSGTDTYVPIYRIVDENKLVTDEPFEHARLLSEYINNGKPRDFDPRKMSLAAKDFDTALSSMLDHHFMLEKEGMPLTFTHDQYDTYARGSKKSRNSSPKPNTKPPSRSPYQQSVVPKNGRPLGKNHAVWRSNRSKSQEAPAIMNATKYTGNMWGPEAKHISVQQKLAKYLDRAAMGGSPVISRKGKSLDDSVIPSPRCTKSPKQEKSQDHRNEWAKLPGVSDETTPQVPELDVDSYTPRIKALPENEREGSFMKAAREQKERVNKIRKARAAAEVIQKWWRMQHARKQR